MPGYRPYNSLKAEALKKGTEKAKITEDFITDKISQEDFQIKAFMINEQKCLLLDLADKELQRINRNEESQKGEWNRWAIMTDGKEGLKEIGDLGWFTGDCDAAYIYKYCRDNGIEIIDVEVYREEVKIVETK